MTLFARHSRLRWAVPPLVVGLFALLALLPTLSASATPDLPAVTPAQLLAKAQQAHVDTLSGTVELTSNLGVPNLSSLQGQTGPASGFNPLDLLSGVHRVDVAYDGPDRQRLVMTGALSENDVYRNGPDLWLWDSQGSSATHYNVPVHEATGHPDQPELTPDQIGQKIVDQLSPSTELSVDTPAYVAGRAVYELVLKPKAAESTVDHVSLAVDSETGLPLRVSVLAKGQSSPALQLAFTSISFSQPSGPFAFTPPAGAKVTQGSATGERRYRGPMPMFQSAPSANQPTTVVGDDWSQVVISGARQIPWQVHDLVRAATPVTGSWGSGRLIETNLVNVLILDDGRVAAGFVTPSALEAAVSHG